MADDDEEPVQESSETASSTGCLMVSVFVFVLLVAVLATMAWLRASGGAPPP